MMGSAFMSTNLARNDDLLFHDQPAQDVKIRSARALPAPTTSHLVPKLLLALALLLTLAWIPFLGWVTFRVVLSLF
jgi:hypothetical protein